MRNAGEALCMSNIGRNGKAAPERPDLPAERTAAEREPWNEGIDTVCETRFAPRAGARDGFFLSEGDKVAVLSPSSLPYRAQAEATMKGLAGWGYVPVEGKHACVDIRTLDDCVGDLRRALEDPEIRAVFCVRGGYGASAVMDRMPEGLIRKAGKMIVGYSDITVYHSAWAAEGVPSVHAPLRMTASAVMVQMMKVSKKTSKEPHSPCSTGWMVLAEEWIIGEVPQPASLE